MTPTGLYISPVTLLLHFHSLAFRFPFTFSAYIHISPWVLASFSPANTLVFHAIAKMRDQSVVEDGYEPSADEDDDASAKLESESLAPAAVFPRSKKRKRVKPKFKKPGRNLQDPLDVCGCDIMSMILSHLDARSVASSLLVSCRWYAVASTDTIWSKKCEELWFGKAHLPRFPQVEGLSKLSAYSLSIEDSKRSRIMKEDLWDHAWEFHFKKEAPEYWRNLDPYWVGTEPPMHRYFHPDGSQTADFGDKVWGGHECCYSIVTSFLADGKIREHYVRINRWPKMSILRRQDWGWEMSNHLYTYSSVPDADKKGGTGPYLPAL